MLIDKLVEQGTLEQNKRWVSLGEKLRDTLPEEKKNSFTYALIDHLNKKVKENK